MSASDLSDDHRARSRFVRGLVQRSDVPGIASSTSARELPKRIVQFWDDLNRLPPDVKECMDSWREVEYLGFERLLFDEEHARGFIRRKLGLRHEEAYGHCYHPAMKSDYFRLCFIFMEGGCYIDTD